MKKAIYLILISSFSVYGQSKQGFIDYDKVLEVLPECKIEQIALDQATIKLNDSLNTLAALYYDSLINVFPHNVRLDSAELALVESKKNNIELRIQELQEFASLKLDINQIEFDKKIKQIVTKELEKYGIANNIDCLVSMEAALFCPNCLDFTADFIKYVRNRKTTH